MRKRRHRLYSQSGFSLAETLVALIIILLVSSIIAAGMPAAQKALVNVRESANAQVFLSTTLTELRNELSTASDIKVNGNSVTYVNPVTGNSKIELDSTTNGRFTITTYMDLNANGTLSGGVSRPLVSDAAKTETLSLNFNSNAPFPAAAYNMGDSCITVTGFGVQSSLTGNASLASIGEYKIGIIVK